MWDELNGGTERLVAEFSSKQIISDELIIKTKSERLLGESNQVERASFLAASEPGLCLQVISVLSLRTQLDADTSTITVYHWVGAPVCEPHVCRC